MFHYRSGSTKQELKGNALARFIFDRTGLSWEGVAVDGVDPDDLTVEKLLGPHRSEPYNPLVAGTFYRAGYVESWGRGIEKVRAACEANGNPMVEFDLDDSGVMATVMQPEWWEEVQLQVAGSGEPASEPQNAPVSEPATERLVRLFADDPSMSYDQAAAALGVSRSSVRRYLRNLEADHRIRRVGADKNGHWEVLG